MRKFLRKKNGQVLVISIAVIFILFIFVIAAIEIGNLMYEKTHMQNIADSGAMEGGMWYARGMNILALSNKVLAVTGVAAVIATLLGAPGAGKDALEFVQRAQDLIAGTGDMEKAGIKPMPLFCAGAVLLNGSDNKALSIPLCNLKDYNTGKWLPSFNVKRRYINDIGDPGKSGQDGDNGASNKDNDKYYYTPKGTDEKVYVDNKYVRINQKLKNKSKAMTIDDPIHGYKLLRKEEAKPKDAGVIPLDIIESSGEHSMLVVSIKNSGQLKLITGVKFLKNDSGDDIKPEFLISTSFVRIAGGKLDIWALDGANYEPHMEHIQFPKIEATDDLADSIGQAANQAQTGGSMGKMGEYLGSALDILNSGVLLH